MGGVLQGRNVVVGVSGGIAAYKAVEVVRELQRQGATVRVAMTAAATRFVGPLTFEALTRHAVLTDVLSLADDKSIDHVEWGHWAHALLLAPASADLMARLAAGMANDAVSALALCVDGPLVVCPAMEPRMWESPLTQRNLRALTEHAHARVVPPGTGPLASGRSGVGRLAEVSDVVAAVTAAFTPRDLDGVRVLVTAGPTREHLDPVRFLSNPSTGKMGVALARAAEQRGARVTLVHGPLAVSMPTGVTAVPVVSALEMLAALQQHLPAADVLLMSAAVGDWRPRERAAQKQKKGAPTENLELVANPDLLVETRSINPACVRVGFAAETERVVEHAADKLKRKGLDMLVANDVSEPGSGFGTDTNRVVILDQRGADPLPMLGKDQVAHAILDRVRTRLRVAP